VSASSIAAPRPETLSPDEVAELSEPEVELLLDTSAAAVERAQAAYSDDAARADYAMALQAYEAVSAQLDAIIEAEGVEGLQRLSRQMVRT
jgi:hypothetical protein